MTLRIFSTVFVFMFLLIGCDSRQETAKPAKTSPKTQPPVVQKLPTYALLREPLEPVLVETSSEALSLWRKSQGSQPALVLLSNDPFLKPIPQELEKATSELIANASAPELSAELRSSSADPLLLPQMALSAALKYNLFSQVIWVISGNESFKEQTAEAFGQHLANYGAINETEAQSFTRNDHGFSGQIQGLPFSAVHESNLPTIPEPVLLHIDLSYFRPIYKGEIKTPLFQLLYQTLGQLHSAKMSAEAVSISLSNLVGNLPLSTRFVGSILSQLFAEPAFLEAPLPDNWEIRRKALYLENFFQKEKVHELYQQLHTNNPTDASASYALYRSLRELKKGTDALEMLAEAVRREPAYGIEYLTLAATAMEKKRPDQALRMLELATAAFPDNPFILLQKAELLINLDHSEVAVKLLEELQRLPWSKVYYPQLPDYIDSLLNTILSAKD